jgi:hypothetical protein
LPDGLFILDLFSFLPYHFSMPGRRRQAPTRKPNDDAGANTKDQNMNAAGQIAVTLAGVIGFGRLFLADEGGSHRLSGLLILAGLVGKIALSI